MESGKMSQCPMETQSLGHSRGTSSRGLKFPLGRTFSSLLSLEAYGYFSPSTTLSLPVKPSHYQQHPTTKMSTAIVATPVPTKDQLAAPAPAAVVAPAEVAMKHVKVSLNDDTRRFLVIPDATKYA